jgi:hypothetical protein
MDIYLASPSNQHQAEMMKGFDVLESFALTATCQWMERYRIAFRKRMLDSGAYSTMTTGKPIDLGKYIEFAVQHGAAYEVIVNLDVISGDVTARVDEGMRNLRRMRDAGIDALPVFHQGEPWSVFAEMTSCGKVGIGMPRDKNGRMHHVEEFLDECFSRLPGCVYTHGFALANEKYTKRYPFSSVDSATWFHELKALMCVEGQGADVLKYQTTGELLELVLRKYRRMPTATAWAGRDQSPLFAAIDGAA